MRMMHDADSHIMEPPDWLTDYADPDVRPKLKPVYKISDKPGLDWIEEARQKHLDPEYRARGAEEIWLRKNYRATGSFLREDRPLALDRLGMAGQPVFNHLHNHQLRDAAHCGHLGYAYG